jgi:hypothetical protein
LRIGDGVIPERSRWVVVVRMDRPEAYVTLQRTFAGSVWVDVVLDRRGGTAAPTGGHAPGAERRGQAFRRAKGGADFQVYEAIAPLPGRCPQCGRPVTVELPRFVEPPVRLELTVVHEAVSPAGVRHVVELQSLSATGRVRLATRLVARARTDVS